MFYFSGCMTYLFTCITEQSYQRVQAPVPYLVFPGIKSQLVHPFRQAYPQQFRVYRRSRTMQGLASNANNEEKIEINV